MESLAKMLRPLSIGCAMALCLMSIVNAQPIPVNIPAVAMAPGTSFKIPVNVGSTTGLYITAYEFEVSCDTSVVQFDVNGIDLAGTLSSNFGTICNSSVGLYGPGKMKVAGASATPLTGSGVLLYLNVTSKSKAGVSPIAFVPGKFLFNTGVPAASLTDGSVRINRRPIINPVSAKTVAQGDSLFFTISATDLDLPNDTLRFSLSTPPQGARVDAVTGVFGWRPTFTHLGPYAFYARVTDAGGMVDSTIVGITVTKTNVKPVFINKMRDTTINQGQTLNFTYGATDQNLDPLTYNLVSPPTGATMSSTGTFTWRPVAPQVGLFTVTAVVSDGLLQDVTTAIVTVVRTNVKPVLNARVPTNVATVSYNKPQTFAVSVTDPNGDPITYTWSVNNSVVKTGTDTSYTVTFTDAQNTAKIVTAVFADPEGLKDSTMWFFTITDIQTDKSVIPTDFALGQNYPNPFNPSTNIQFDLPRASSVTLEVFNVSGARIRSLLKGENIGAGSHTMLWDGRDSGGRMMPSGVYMYRISAGDFHAWKKMTLLK